MWTQRNDDAATTYGHVIAELKESSLVSAQQV
jgi:hypothetical protein